MAHLKVFDCGVVFHVVKYDGQELHFFGQLIEQDVGHLVDSVRLGLLLKPAEDRLELHLK